MSLFTGQSGLEHRAHWCKKLPVFVPAGATSPRYLNAASVISLSSQVQYLSENIIFITVIKDLPFLLPMLNQNVLAVSFFQPLQNVYSLSHCHHSKTVSSLLWAFYKQIPICFLISKTVSSFQTIGHLRCLYSVPMPIQSLICASSGKQTELEDLWSFPSNLAFPIIVLGI